MDAAFSGLTISSKSLHLQPKPPAAAASTKPVATGKTVASRTTAATRTAAAKASTGAPAAAAKKPTAAVAKPAAGLRPTAIRVTKTTRPVAREPLAGVASKAAEAAATSEAASESTTSSSQPEPSPASTASPAAAARKVTKPRYAGTSQGVAARGAVKDGAPQPKSIARGKVWSEEVEEGKADFCVPICLRSFILLHI